MNCSGLDERKEDSKLIIGDKMKKTDKATKLLLLIYMQTIIKETEKQYKNDNFMRGLIYQGMCFSLLPYQDLIKEISDKIC